MTRVLPLYDPAVFARKFQRGILTFDHVSRIPEGRMTLKEMLVLSLGSGGIGTLLGSVGTWINARRKSQIMTEDMVKKTMSKALEQLSDQCDKAMARADTAMNRAAEANDRCDKSEEAHRNCEERVRDIRNEFDLYIRANPAVPGYTGIKRTQS